LYPKKPILFLFLIYTIGIYFSFGQVQKDTISISEIVLNSSPIKNKILDAAYSAAIVSDMDFHKTDGITLTPVLNKIPGVFMQQASLSTNRISIRGIGARAPFGTNRVKAYLNSIPLTSGDGETVIDAIDLGAIEKLEIIKGPNATSFGSGLGGVIHFRARQTPNLESFGTITSTYGSFGLMQQHLSAGYSDSNSNLFTSFSDLQTDGYRDNSAFSRKTINCIGTQKIAVHGSLSFLGIFSRLKAFIPSSLNEEDYTNSPEKAAPAWAAAQGFESLDKYRFGLGYEQQIKEKWTLNTSLFSSFIENYEARPFDILQDKTNSFGLRLHINYKDYLFSIPYSCSLGTELLTEKYQYALFKNDYLSQPGQGSIQGDQFSEVLQNRCYANYFLQMEVWLLQNFKLEAGMAFNSTQYTIENIFQANSDSQKDNYSFGTVWTPRLGLSYNMVKGKNIYVSISKGFSIPSVAESLTTEGQINTDLQPEIGWNYELGFKGNWFENKMYTALTFFSTQIENILVARRTAADQYVGVNAGSSAHPGVEFLINYTLFDTSHFQLNPYFSAALNYFTFKDFVDAKGNYSGNNLTGVPDKQWSLGLDVNLKNGIGFYMSYLHVGKIPMNDSNTKYSQEYAVLDIKAIYSFTLFKRCKTEFHAGINNALNEKYTASILPNAVGFGAALPRYYYPGNPIQYFGGFSLSYSF
jgi:iron complex outermembrane recepter protein